MILNLAPNESIIVGGVHGSAWVKATKDGLMIENEKSLLQKDLEDWMFLGAYLMSLGQKLQAYAADRLAKPEEEEE